MKTPIKLLILGALITLPAILGNHKASAAVDTCTWTGAVSVDWDDNGNWTGCDNGSLPEAGDSLIFPEAASNKTTNNDFAPLSFTSIQISGSGYTLSGTGLTLTGTTPLTINQNATIDINITYAPSLNAFLRVASGQTLTINGTTTFLGITGEVNVGTGGFSGTIDFTNSVNGAAGSQFIAVNGATAIVRHATNNYVASAVGAESGGTFVCRTSSCFGDNGNDIYSGNGTVEIRVSNTFSNDWLTAAPSAGDTWLRVYESVSISGSGTVNDAIGVSQNTDGESLQFTGPITLNNSMSVFGSSTDAAVRFDGAVSGAGGYSIAGVTAYLNVANSYAGTTTVNDDTRVIVGNSDGLGTTAGITRVLDGGAVVLNGSTPLIVPENFTITGRGLGGTTAALDHDSAEDVTLSGVITLDGDASIRTVQPGSDSIISGAINGTGSLTLTSQWDPSNAATITISGAAPNTYVGDTILEGGVVYFQKTGAIPENLFIDNQNPSTNRVLAYFYTSSDVMSDTGILTFGSNDHNNITFGANNEIIGGIEGPDGTVSIQDALDRVIIDQDHDSTFGGDFYTDGNANTVEKRGTGVLTLTGDFAFTFDEITFVLIEGTLVVDGNIRTANGGNVTVNGGTLKGSGTVRAVTMNGGTLAPGNSPGILVVTDLTLTGANTLQQEINGVTAGTEYDQIQATGAVTLGGATLSLSLATTPADGTVFTIITAGSVNGTFNGLPNGATITVNGVTFRVNYSATSVTLTKIAGTVTPATLQSTGSTQVLVSIFAGAILMVVTAAIMVVTKSQETLDITINQ